MRVLVDTHTLLWWLTGDSSLSAPARRVIGQAGHTVLVSAASAWEIGIKVRLGKLPGAESVAANFDDCLLRERFEALPITVEHGIRAGLLPGPHRDPFDRMLAAQCQAENLPLVSNDSAFDALNVRRIW